MSGTIDGISYASTSYVYDPDQFGVVTNILYLDQNGTQVADQQVYNFNPILITDDIKNADGTFTLKLEEPGANGGLAKPYSVDTFSSTGIWLREDSYTPNFIDPSQPDGGGVSGYSETGYILVNSQTSGTINGASYDMVESHYNPSGNLIETDYLYDLNGQMTVVDKVTNVAPNPVITAPTTATVAAGTAQALSGISIADDWAASHAGSLALNITVSAGTLTGETPSGQAFTATPGSPVHLSGTLATLNSDLSQLSFTGSDGTAQITYQVYDQAGVSATRTETLTVGAGPVTAAAPDPAFGGITQASVATGTALSLNGVTFSDAWATSRAGTLALNISTNLGTLSDTGGGVTGSGSSALHAVGTVAQLQADLAALTLTSSQTGTANVNFTVYDQAGAVAFDLVGVTVHAAA